MSPSYYIHSYVSQLLHPRKPRLLEIIIEDVFGRTWSLTLIEILTVFSRPQWSERCGNDCCSSHEVQH
jgi:hypothetical protein